MTPVRVRPMDARDRPAWLAMYHTIFAGKPETQLLREIDRVLADPKSGALIAGRDGAPVGFAEYAFRPYANGCHSKPVPFLEGIWVDPAHRRQGVATALIRSLEELVRKEGFSEIGSDVDLGNLLALDVHRNLGFEETERVVYFRKTL